MNSNFRNILAMTVFAAAFFALFPSLRAGSELEELGNTMAHFYENPSEKAFEKFQKDIANFDSFFKSRPQPTMLVAVFIAKTSEKYGYPIMESPFAEMAARVSDPKSKIGKFVNDDKEVSPTKLDVWWACFSATGDDKYLEKIFGFVGRDMDKDRNVSHLLIYGAANWSFKSNCRQHDKVMKFAKAKLEKGKLSPSQKKFLESCVNQKDDKKEKPATP